MKCPRCNSEIAENSKFCNNCGYNFEKPQAQQPQYQQQPMNQPQYQQPTIVINNVANANATAGFAGTSTKSKMVALLLCVFLGYFGAHQFYAGKIGAGILYLCTFGLCGVMWILDIIKILSGTFKDGNGLPIR